MKNLIGKHKKLSITLLVLVILLAGGFGAGCEYFYRVAFVPAHKSFLSSGLSARQRDDRNWLADTAKEKWTQAAAGHSSWTLRADYVPAATKSNKTIVVAHGYMNTKEDMATYIRMFHNAGYNVLAPDDRGHGQSDGNYIGYGWADRKDYLLWIQQLLRKKGTNQQLGLYGLSMGGATVMYLSGEKLPHQVKAIVEDCGYSSVDGEISYQAGSMYNLPRWPLVPGVLRVAQMHTGVDFKNADALTALRKNHLPTFFIHGAKDKFVPTKMVHANYKASAGKKQLWIVPGAGHAQSIFKAPQQYQERVTDFLARYMR